MPDPDLVVLRRYRFEYEARIAHDMLRDAGIGSMVKGDVFDPELATITDVSLLVRPEDAERARAALDRTPGRR